jgi:hypothetical protein
MPELGELTLQWFAGRVGEPFVIHPPAGQPVQARLAEVTKLSDPFTDGARESFSVLFRADRERILAQGVYRIENEAMGEVGMFIVPLEPDAEGARYEAIFT